MKKEKISVDLIYFIIVGVMAGLFFLFHTVSFLKGVFYSFTDWKGYGAWNFVGLRNYLQIFRDGDTPTTATSTPTARSSTSARRSPACRSRPA